MAALAADRDTLERDPRIRSFPVAEDARIYQGALVGVNADGFLVPMSASTTLKVAGRAEEGVDNAEGENGAVSVMVASGCFRWNNSTLTERITRADIGADCYAVDDQTVAKTNGTNTRSRAGRVHDVDGMGVWVIS